MTELIKDAYASAVELLADAPQPYEIADSDTENVYAEAKNFVDAVENEYDFHADYEGLPHLTALKNAYTSCYELVRFADADEIEDIYCEAKNFTQAVENMFFIQPANFEPKVQNLTKTVGFLFTVRHH